MILMIFFNLQEILWLYASQFSAHHLQGQEHSHLCKAFQLQIALEFFPYTVNKQKTTIAYPDFCSLTYSQMRG